jgi:hypothetical protein
MTAKWPFGPRCCDGEGVFKAEEKSARAAEAGSTLLAEVGTAERRDRSHTLSKARPCAILARRATVQGVEASRSLSRVSIFDGEW